MGLFKQVINKIKFRDATSYYSQHSPVTYRVLLALPGPVLSGLFIYFVLSSLLVPFRITGPTSVIMSILIFGLTCYYNRDETSNKEAVQNKSRASYSSIFFIAIYIVLIIFAFNSKQHPGMFVPWDQVSQIQIARLIAAIIISLFAPGYALVSTLDRRGELRALPRLLIAYLFSFLVTGLVAYTTSSIGLPFSAINMLLGVINLLILAQFVWIKIFREKDIPRPLYFPDARIIYELLKGNISQVLVFVSLFAIVTLSTYYLYSGTIIGDQWFHHGRAHMFLDGTFKDIASSGIDLEYPAFLPAFLAAFFALSSIPSANAYVSINFLNFIPVIAFYYFFSIWIPKRRKATLLASALFMLSSGFGWAYLLNLVATNTISSPEDALNIISTASIKTFDIWAPNNFIDVGHPDITTGLIIVGLPAGFVLLGLIKENIRNKFEFIILIAGVIILGYLTHDEFGFFIIIGTVVTLFFGLNGRNSIFGGILAGLLFVGFVAICYPTGLYYQTTRDLTIVPILGVYILFVSFMWALTLVRHRVICTLSRLRIMSNALKKIIRSRVRFVLSIALLAIVSYIYLLSFIIWNNQLPIFDIRANTNGFNVVPWHLYPLRFGVCGILGSCFVISYIIKKFEKEIFILGVIAIIGFIIASLPFYIQFRVDKYIMIGISGLASLMLYKILSLQKQSRKRVLISGTLIGLVITSSGLSLLMYLGYVGLGLETPTDFFDDQLPNRHFPSGSDLRLMEFLHNHINIKNDENIALPANQIYGLHNLAAMLTGFAGMLPTKLYQSPWTLHQSSLEGFFTLLNYTNTRFIVLPKQFIKSNGLSEVLGFALYNFKTVYEDDKYIVLSVPDLMPPSSKGGDIALVYQSQLTESQITEPTYLNATNYYYPLSALALSKMKYDTFIGGDFSALSKKYLVLTWDPSNIDNAYFEYVKNGGTIVILDTNKNFNGAFSKILCIKPGTQDQFDGIANSGSGQPHLKILGLATHIDVLCPGSIIRSSYIRSGYEISPFAIEKGYGNGKIIFVNISGYFTALSKYPQRFFLTLENMTGLMGLQAAKVFSRGVILNGTPFPYFFGDLNMSGRVMMDSSSLLLPTNYDIYAENISIKKQTLYPSSLYQDNFNKVHIRDLRLIGDYQVMVNSSNPLYSSESTNSLSGDYNYFLFNLPVGSNISIKLFRGGTAEFLNSKNNQIVKITGGGVEFKNIKGLIPVLLKAPEIEVDGKASFQELYTNDPNKPNRFVPPWDDFAPVSLEAKGKTGIKFNHISNDAYGITTHNNTPKYLTYFKWIELNTHINKPKEVMQGQLLSISWPSVIKSGINIWIILILLAASLLLIYFKPQVKKVLR